MAAMNGGVAAAGAKTRRGVGPAPQHPPPNTVLGKRPGLPLSKGVGAAAVARAAPKRALGATGAGAERRSAIRSAHRSRWNLPLSLLPPSFSLSPSLCAWEQVERLLTAIGASCSCLLCFPGPQPSETKREEKRSGVPWRLFLVNKGERGRGER